MQNLRAAKASNGSTGLLGASALHNKFRARITVNHREIHLGAFNTPELAHAAYVEAKRKLHNGCTI